MAYKNGVLLLGNHNSGTARILKTNYLSEVDTAAFQVTPNAEIMELAVQTNSSEP